MSRPLRIAIGQVSSESNHFVACRADLEFFRTTGYLYEGDQVLKLGGTDTELGGIIETMGGFPEVEIVPLLATRANSSGPLSRECYCYLRDSLLNYLRAAGPLDGIILSHHGSMCAEGEPDCEGDIAAAVREIVGPDVPIALTLDLHGNVTRRMVESTNVIVSYEHYPHDDAFSTGQRAANLLLSTIRGEIRPTMALAKLPMLLTGFNASTLGDGPFVGLMDEVKKHEGQSNILSTSCFLVGSYIDVPEIGCGILTITDDDPAQASQTANELAHRYWGLRDEFLHPTVSVAEAVRRSDRIAAGPILLLDTADTTGGGASGDGIGVVRGLIDARVTAPGLAMVVDPSAAKACEVAGVGATITVDLGHGIDPRWGEPLRVTGKVLRVSDGRFKYNGGIFGGTWASMGLSAVLEVGPIQILVTTWPTYDWGREQYESMGMRCESARFIGVKNMMNFRTGYRDIMKACFVLDLPGPTPADMRMLTFSRVQRPMFPLDQVETPSVVMYRSRAREAVLYPAK